jgi:hypothetical protein
VSYASVFPYPFSLSLLFYKGLAKGKVTNRMAGLHGLMSRGKVTVSKKNKRRINTKFSIITISACRQ